MRLISIVMYSLSVKKILIQLFGGFELACIPLQMFPTDAGRKQDSNGLVHYHFQQVRSEGVSSLSHVTGYTLDIE